MKNKHRKQQRNLLRAYRFTVGYRARRIPRGIWVMTSTIDPALLAKFRAEWEKMISGVDGWYPTKITPVEEPRG